MPCCGGKFLQVSITHPKRLTHFSYKCSFTMISKFRADMSDTCYPGMSARTGKKNSLSQLLLYKSVQAGNTCTALSETHYLQSQDIQNRRRHQAWVHGGNGGTASILLPAINHRNRIKSCQIEGQKASYRSILQCQPTWLPFVTR